MPRFNNLIVSLFVANSLVACNVGGGSSSNETTSGYGTVGADEFLSHNLTQQSIYKVIDDKGIGYSYGSGIDDRGRYTTLAALVGEERIVDTPTSGSAKFTGRASGTFIDRAGEGQSYSDAETFSRSVVLRADFSSGTFRGRTPERFYPWDVQLTFSGKIEDGKLKGKSRLTRPLMDIQGTFDGAIGDDQAVAVFHGHNDEDTFAGGLNVSR